jgi:putative ABC transport system substrate-binding protein
MRRIARLTAALLFLVALLVPGSIPAQQPERVVRIGVLYYYVPMEDVETYPPSRALVEGLREKGWVEGRNARIVWKSAEGRPERIPALVEELLRIPVDVLVGAGNDMAAESVKRSPSIPVVLPSADFPVESGLVASLSRPGGSITGISNWVGRSLNAKRLALLKEAAPELKRVALLVSSEGARNPGFSSETQAAADAIGITLFKVAADHASELDRAFDNARRLGAGGIFVADYPFALLRKHQLMISELAARHRIPVIHSASTAADAGALLTYAHDINENFRRAGHIVDKILRGAKAGDIPFEEPATLKLVVNLGAARAIGLTVPQSILIQANRVID